MLRFGSGRMAQHDMGYDISDYREIWEPYGTMKDFDELLKGVHDRGMKLM
jgi:glycosidase